jgi:hypothetical protein
MPASGGRFNFVCGTEQNSPDENPPNNLVYDNQRQAIGLA